MSYRQVQPGELSVGTPLETTLYSKTGTVIAQAGAALSSEHQLQLLIEKGIFVKDLEEAEEKTANSQEAEEVTNVFVSLDKAKVRLKRLFDQLVIKKGQEEFFERVNDVAATIQKCCELDLDATLANVHIENEFPYSVLHHLQAALLCEATARKLGVKDEPRLSLIKAALTHDIDLLDIQHVLDRQTIPLSDMYKVRINTHPTETAERLRELGVNDNTWLTAVEQHHERLDGSGYGKGLSGSAITIPARILAIADIYSAMIRNRATRKAIPSKEALRRLMTDSGGKIDNRLTQIMIKEVGVYPPGTILKLVSNEIAVVKSKPESGIHPIAYAFINAAGKPMSETSQRDTSAAEFKIVSILPFSAFHESFEIIRKLWL